MSMRTYTYGSDCVVVETGMPEHAVRIGIGASWAEAVADLRSTAIQSAGSRPVTTALEWAHGAGWIDDLSDLEEVEVDLDEEIAASEDDSDT